MGSFNFAFGGDSNRDFEVSMRDKKGLIQITCYGPGSECSHVLARSKFSEFNLELLAAPEQDSIDAARDAVKAGRAGDVYLAIHTIAKVDFVWYETDW